VLLLIIKISELEKPIIFIAEIFSLHMILDGFVLNYFCAEKG